MLKRRLLALSIAGALLPMGRLHAQQALDVRICFDGGDSAPAAELGRGLGDRLQMVDRPPVSVSYGGCQRGDTLEVDYIVEVAVGLAEADTSLLAARVQVFSPEWALWATFEDVHATSLDELVVATAPRLITTVTRPIRIAMVRFALRGGDSTRYGGFSTALPHMIREQLLVSSRIVLVEQDTLLRGQMEAHLRDAGALDPTTLLRYGRRLGANYLVLGDYLEHEGALWVDVQTVSVETGQVLLTEGVVVEPISLRALQQAMTELGDVLRTSISEDFLAQPGGPRYLALNGFPPYPDTGENRRLLDAVVRNAARKLRAAGIRELRVQDIPEGPEELVGAGGDRWQITSERGADFLVSFQLDRSHLDSLVVDVDVFDPARPRDAVFSDHLIVPVDAVDDQLVPSLERLLDALLAPGRSLTDDERAALRSHPYRGLIRRIDFPVRAGIGYQGSDALFATVRAGLELEGGVRVFLDDGGHWSVGPTVSLFALGARGDAKVLGGDILGRVAYHFRPHLVRNPYLAVSGGLMGVARFGTGDFNTDARFGVGVAVGFEQTLASARTITWELEFRRAVGEVPPKNLAGVRFEGGRPGGFSLTIGTTW